MEGFRLNAFAVMGEDTENILLLTRVPEVPRTPEIVI